MRKFRNNITKEALTQFAIRIRELFGEQQETVIMRTMFEQMGGMRVTIPTLEELEIHERNREIREKFNGKNYLELAENWGLTTKSIRRIVSQM